MNYLAYTAIADARRVCTAVKTNAKSVPPSKKSGLQSPIPSNYVNGAPRSWWSSKSAKYCPKNTVCLPGPKIEVQSNPQVQFIAADAGGDAMEDELRYRNTSVYTHNGCLFGAQGVSVYDIAQVWQTTFPQSSIDTCAAALISTQVLRVCPAHTWTSLTQPKYDCRANASPACSSLLLRRTAGCSQGSQSFAAPLGDFRLAVIDLSFSSTF